jgi:hypothetical protein
VRPVQRDRRDRARSVEQQVLIVGHRRSSVGQLLA